MGIVFVIAISAKVSMLDRDYRSRGDIFVRYASLQFNVIIHPDRFKKLEGDKKIALLFYYTRNLLFALLVFSRVRMPAIHGPFALRRPKQDGSRWATRPPRRQLHYVRGR